MKKIFDKTFATYMCVNAFIALSVLMAACCGGNGQQKEWPSRNDEIAHKCKLPAGAHVLAELNSDEEQNVWCVFLLAGDTILLHRADYGQASTESMCVVDGEFLSHVADGFGEESPDK